MKYKIMKIIKVVLLLLILFIPIYIAPISRADSGWDSSYGGGGGSYGGGSYGGGYSGGYGGSYGGGYSSGGSYSGELDAAALVATFLVFITLIILLGYIASKAKPPVDDKNKYLMYAFQDITEEKLKAIMPNDNLEHLKLESFHNFVQIQDAWMNFDYKTLREYCSDELYNTYKSQLETLKIKNGQNIMSEYDNIDTKIIDIKSVNGEIIMTVFMCVEFFDYVINIKTKEITRGTDEHKLLNNYIMTFVMKDSKTSKKITKCPNCGAKIKHNTSGECEYCNATIVKKASKFVLTTKKNINK